MTMGNDMSPLFPDVMACIQLNDLEIKKMVYLYMINYAKVKQDLVHMVIAAFKQDANHSDPLIRALALRTMSNIPVQKAMESFCGPLLDACGDRDPYVRKTAALCISKVYFFSKELAMGKSLLDALKKMLIDGNATVVANALVAAMEIHERSSDFDLAIDINTASTLVAALTECSEWYQTYITEALMFVTPTKQGDAETLIDRLMPRLQHSNSGLVLATIKVIIYFLNFCPDSKYVQEIYNRLGAPLISLTNNEPEIQYVAMRNILLIVQKHPEILQDDMMVFFCKYNDPSYLKLSKLEIMFRLVNENNVDALLSELKEYATEVDVDFVRKSVRAIGRCAIKIPSCANKCIQSLVELIKTKVNYVVQEAIVVIRDIFRKYPNQYESVIGILCENLDELDEPEAKASMIWIIGHYADRIDNSAELMTAFTESFLDEPAEIQLALLTAVVKLFMKRPKEGQELLPNILKLVTEKVDNPDVRDRGYIYLRLLSVDPVVAKSILFPDNVTVEAESENVDPAFLDEMLLYIDSYLSIVQKPLRQVFGNLKPRRVKKSVTSSFTALPVSKKSSNALMGDLADFSSLSVSQDKRVAQVAQQPQQQNNNVYGDLLSLDVDIGYTPAPAKMPAFAPAAQNIDLLMDNASTYATPMSAPVSQIPIQAMSNRKQSQQMSDFGLLGLNSGTAAPVTQISPSNPFSATNIQQKTSSSVQDLFALVEETGYIPPKQLYLNSNNARGMELQGTFARRNGMISFELTIVNRALAPLSDFMMQFNKNSFGFVPGPLTVNGPIAPNQVAEIKVPLSVNPAFIQPSQILNNIHVAIKNNAGVFYFQCAIPLHVIFTEAGQVTQNDFLQLWRAPDSMTVPGVIDGLHLESVDVLRRRLNNNNLFIIAERQTAENYDLFVHAKVNDQVNIMTEIKIVGYKGTGPISRCEFQVKSKLQTVLPLFKDCLTLILKH